VFFVQERSRPSVHGLSTCAPYHRFRALAWSKGASDITRPPRRSVISEEGRSGLSRFRPRKARTTLVLAVLRIAPPPDFRYVSLVPGPSFRALTLAAGTVGLSSLGLALGPDAAAWSLTSGSVPIGLAVAGGAAFAVGLARQILRPKAPSGAIEVNMAIVPWGVVVDPGSSSRILRWPAIREIDVDVKHTLRGGTPAIVASVVTIRTDRDALSGHAPGAVGLEALSVNLAAYAEEASRPASTDLDGQEPLGDFEISPVFGDLLWHAEELCSTSRGAARLSLPSGGYRKASVQAAVPETLAVLSRSLVGDVPGAADPRPLAAIVAGLLGAEELVPHLVRLSGSPNPVVAAVARASAFRLGVLPSKVGSLEELGDFLFEEDLRAVSEFGRV